MVGGTGESGNIIRVRTGTTMARMERNVGGECFTSFRG
jgi:hypothetical protein